MPLDAGNRRHVFEQQGEVRELAVSSERIADVPRYALTFCPSSVTSLTPWAASSATSVRTSSSGRDTSSPRVYGTTQKRAVLAAAFHDRHEGAAALDACRRQVIELFDFRETRYPLAGGRSRGARSIIAGQPVQRLRTEYEIDIGSARDDRGAFLARDATAHADERDRRAALSNARTRPRS